MNAILIGTLNRAAIDWDPNLYKNDKSESIIFNRSGCILCESDFRTFLQYKARIDLGFDLEKTLKYE